MKQLQVCAVTLAPIGFTAVSVFTDPFNVGLLLTIIGVIATIVAFLIFRKRHRDIVGWPSAILNRPIWLLFPVTAIATGGTCGIYIEHNQHIQDRLMPIEDGRPWRDGLIARVYWNKQPSKEMRKGFGDTVKLLGFSYHDVDSVEDANMRMWLNSWKYNCKWPATEGLASLDLNPSNLGSQVGDIHICRVTTPYTWDRLPEYSLMAHETAHLLAAQEHIGDGLMAEGGGDGSRWFNDSEIQAMCEKIDAFHRSARSTADHSIDWSHQRSGDESPAKPACGSEELRPQPEPRPEG